MSTDGSSMQTALPSDFDTSGLPEPAWFMRPEHLAKLVPSRLSASRSLLHLMSRQRWEIEAVRFDIDERARGEAVYRVRTPEMTFDFIVFSFEPKLEGRTGRIIGTDWDMMGALLEGEATEADIRRTREELPKLYAGRAPERTLVWCRSNRSLRLFDHVVTRLAAGRQPDVDELRKVGYLMRNTGLDGNGTFGTRSFLALEDDHPLRTPYHAQMLAAYLMREFAFDLAEHLARHAGETAVPLDPELKRFLGLGNGSALGLVFFANTHPALLDRWLMLRCAAVRSARAIPAAPGSVEWRRAGELLSRAVEFYAQDSFAYHDFTPATEIADGLRMLAKRFAEHPGAPSFGQLLDAIADGVIEDAVEVFNAILLELRPEETDALLRYQPVDEELTRDPAAEIGSLRRFIEEEYAWALGIDLRDPAQRRFRWYKSSDAEEPRRGPVEEVPGGFEWALDLPGDVQRLHGKLRECDELQLVGEFLVRHPEERATVQRVQGLAEGAYHSPRMNMLAEDFIPVHIVRLMNATFHGLDKTVDAFGRSVLGLLFHGAPNRADLRAGRCADWIYPSQPKGASA